MDRNEAVNYLKELLRTCNDMSPEAVSFERPIVGDSQGYTVRIKGIIQESDKQTVKEIATKYRFAVKEEKGEVYIFTPKKNA